MACGGVAYTSKGFESAWVGTRSLGEQGPRRAWGPDLVAGLGGPEGQFVQCCAGSLDDRRAALRSRTSATLKTQLDFILHGDLEAQSWSVIQSWK